MDSLKPEIVITLIDKYESTPRDYVTKKLRELLADKKYKNQYLQELLGVPYTTVHSYTKKSGNKIPLKYLMKICLEHEIPIGYFLL